MKDSRAFVIGLLASILALASGVYIGIEVRGDGEKQALLPENNAPDQEAIDNFFTVQLNDPEGNTVDLARFKGKILVINFWATWCSPCRDEMPEFSALQTRYAGNGVQFVGIALDSADNVSRFAKQYQVTYPLLASDTRGADLARTLGDTRVNLPYSIVLSADGRILMTRLGRVPRLEIDALLQKAAHR